jgi:hypothetical protein
MLSISRKRSRTKNTNFKKSLIMNLHILNQDLRTFYISLHYRTTNGKFIFQTAEEFKFILETYDNPQKGIEFIKVFEPSKNKFVNISKKDLLKFFNWETEFIEFSKNHYYFKSI